MLIGGAALLPSQASTSALECWMESAVALSNIYSLKRVFSIVVILIYNKGKYYKVFTLLYLIVLPYTTVGVLTFHACAAPNLTLMPACARAQFTMGSWDAEQLGIAVGRPAAGASPLRAHPGGAVTLSH